MSIVWVQTVIEVGDQPNVVVLHRRPEQGGTLFQLFVAVKQWFDARDDVTGNVYAFLGRPIEGDPAMFHHTQTVGDEDRLHVSCSDPHTAMLLKLRWA